MPAIRKALRRKMHESKAKDIITDSKLDFDDRLEQARFFGEYYPVPIKSIDEDGSTISINFELPRIINGKEKRSDAELSIKTREGDVHSISLRARGFGLLYNEYLEIDDEIREILKDNTHDKCAVPSTRTQRLIAILYDTGDIVDFAGGYVEVERPFPILELIGMEIKAELPEHIPPEEIKAETMEEPEKITEVKETVEEEQVPGKEYWKETLDDDEIRRILQITQSTLLSYRFRHYIPSNPTRNWLTKYILGRKKMKKEKDNLAAMNRLLSKDFGSMPELRSYLIKELRPHEEAVDEPSPAAIEQEYLDKELDVDKIANILETSINSVQSSISQGYLKGKKVRDVAERIRRRMRLNDKGRLKMYNRLVETAGIGGMGEFGSVEEAYSTLSGIKKKLD